MDDIDNTIVDFTKPNAGRIYDYLIGDVSYGTIHLFKIELVEGLFDYFAENPFSVEMLKTIMDKSIITLKRMRGKGDNN